MKPNPKYEIDYAEFYITNVCNLACPGCNHFNNFNLKGYWRWNDLKETYSQWSQELDIKSIAILGGEPLLNPEFLNWAVGVSELWPNCMVRIISNGLQIDRVKGFYDVLKSNPRIKLWVGIHNKKHKKESKRIDPVYRSSLWLFFLHRVLCMFVKGHEKSIKHTTNEERQIWRLLLF